VARHPQKFKFSKHATIGANDALEDKFILDDAFVDLGTLKVFRDTNRPECIVLGRTGSGKTALLETLASSESMVVKLDPKALALSYLSDNQVLKFFVELGVDMELFYNLLWRHVFAVEIIKRKYNIDSEGRVRHFLGSILSSLGLNKRKQQAIAYLTNWGSEFWKDAENRILETTAKLETDLRNTFSGEASGKFASLITADAKINRDMSKKLTEESKSEIRIIGQQVVDKIQIRELNEVMDFIATDILKDTQNRMYITIDRLDEKWVSDSLRYSLIRALIDAIREFNNKIVPLKIIIALRLDLLERVFKYTRGQGYQEEKYRSMQLELRWIHGELEELLDARVQVLIRGYDLPANVNTRYFLPRKIKDYKDPLEFLLIRTMNRPRDTISFFNECIKQAHGQSKITVENMFGAEGIYSNFRLRALTDEWVDDFADLHEASAILTGWPVPFTWAMVEERFDDALLDFLVIGEKKQGHRQIYDDLLKHMNFGTSQDAFISLMKTFYHVGLIGIRAPKIATIHWSFETEENALVWLAQPTTQYHIQPGFWRVLKVNPRVRPH